MSTCSHINTNHTLAALADILGTAVLADTLETTALADTLETTALADSLELLTPWKQLLLE
jgi:hypothetical protein